MNIALWLQRIAYSHPHLPAIGVGPKSFQTYQQLFCQAARLASGICHKYDLKAGDRVGLVMENNPQYIQTLLAIWHAGLVAVPINAKLHANELSFILENARANLCVVSDKTHQAVSTIAKCHLVNAQSSEFARLSTHEETPLTQLSPNTLAWLFYTSGTTGKPKGAMLTHRNLMTMTLNYFTDFDRIRPGDTIFHPAPLSHGAGLWMLPHICAGACNVLPQSARFDPAEIFADLKAWKNVSMFAAPTMVRRLTLHDHDVDTSNLKLITYGGAPMYVTDCIAALDRFGPKFAQLYGQGECPMTISHLPRAMIADRDHPDWNYRLGTAGVIDSCVSVKIADEAGNHLPVGETGEIVCQGDTVMAGYWNNPKATAGTIKNGWLHTGDIGHLDANRFLTLTDRAKDLIISGGSNIYPREVEEVLLTANGVDEVSVVSRPDPDWGEVVVAYVVGEANPEQLDQHCLEKLARFKRPKTYRFVDALPKNNYGKILKTTLRDMEKKHH